MFPRTLPAIRGNVLPLPGMLYADARDGFVLGGGDAEEGFDVTFYMGGEHGQPGERAAAGGGSRTGRACGICF